MRLANDGTHLSKGNIIPILCAAFTPPVLTMSHWIVVAISGVTSGGKSTLTKRLLDNLPTSTKLLCQDDYFYPEDSQYHVPSPGGLSHHNWDVITSMDMEKMKRDIQNIINAEPKDGACISLSPESLCPPTSGNNISSYRPVLLLDGFLLYDDAELTEMCNLRYFFTLNREQCWERRCTRVYEPPDPSGYFEHCVWPMYELHLDRVRNSVQNVLFLNGMKDHFETVYQQIVELAKLE